jgi:hypothetical protein
MKKRQFIIILGNLLALCLIILIINGCSNKGENKTKEERSKVSLRPTETVSTTFSTDSIKRPRYQFRIHNTNISEIPKVVKKIEYIVIIGQKYNENELNEIADYIKKTDTNSIGIEYVFISFYLKGMSLNAPNYAISKRTPELYSTEITFKEVKKNPQKVARFKATYAEAQIIGKWTMMPGAMTVIYRKGASYYMVDEFSDSYGDPDKLIKFSFNGKIAFRYAEDTGEVFVIREDGLYGYMDGDFASVFSNAR